MRQDEVAWTILRRLGISPAEMIDALPAELALRRFCWRHRVSGTLFVLLQDGQGLVQGCVPVDEAGVALLELSVSRGEEIQTTVISMGLAAWARAQLWDPVLEPPTVSLEAIVERIQGDL